MYQCVQCNHAVRPYLDVHVHHDQDRSDLACLECGGVRGFHRPTCAELDEIVLDTCPKCIGSGVFQFSGGEGTCYLCDGKGKVTLGDLQRSFNWKKARRARRPASYRPSQSRQGSLFPESAETDSQEDHA